MLHVVGGVDHLHQALWPRADREILEDTAMDLLGAEKWRRLSPEVAAVAWLRQGVLEQEIKGADRNAETQVSG